MSGYHNYQDSGEIYDEEDEKPAKTVAVAKEQPVKEKEEKKATAEKSQDECHWSTRFQELLSMPESNEALAYEKYARLAKLAVDLVESVRQYGEIVIAEQFLPESARTLKPQRVGGTAGGDKFIVRGILFKLTKDPQLSASKFLYGGARPNYEFAAKAAGHEVKGAANYFEAALATGHTATLCIPIQVTLDFWGYRLLAMPLLPLGTAKLVYGSGDGGKTVHADNTDLNKIMQELGSYLHVAEHVVRGTSVVSAADIECHIAADGRFYLLDLARAFPPEFPGEVRAAQQAVERKNSNEGTSKQSQDEDGGKEEGNSVFFRLLRPEYLKLRRLEGNPPLSPDALTGFGVTDYKTHNSIVKVATADLINLVIPQFANEIDSGTVTLSHDSISEMVHKRGINIRHIGILRAILKNRPARQLLLVQMVGRTAKNLLRAELRKAVETSGTKLGASLQAVLDAAATFLRLVSGYSADAMAFWSNKLVSEVAGRFGSCAIGPKERENSALFDSLAPSLSDIIKYVSESCGVVLGQRCLKELKEQGAVRFCFFGADLFHGAPRVKHVSVLDYATARSLLASANVERSESITQLINQPRSGAGKSAPASVLVEQSKRAMGASAKGHGPGGYVRLYRLSAEHFQAVLRSNPFHVPAQYGLALATAEELQHAPNSRLQVDRVMVKAASQMLESDARPYTALILEKLFQFWAERVASAQPDTDVCGYLCGAANSEMLTTASMLVNRAVAADHPCISILNTLDSMLETRDAAIRTALLALREDNANFEGYTEQMNPKDLDEAVTRAVTAMADTQSMVMENSGGSGSSGGDQEYAIETAFAQLFDGLTRSRNPKLVCLSSLLTALGRGSPPHWELKASAEKGTVGSGVSRTSNPNEFWYIRHDFKSTPTTITASPTSPSLQQSHQSQSSSSSLPTASPTVATAQPVQQSPTTFATLINPDTTPEWVFNRSGFCTITVRYGGRSSSPTASRRVRMLLNDEIVAQGSIGQLGFCTAVLSNVQMQYGDRVAFQTIPSETETNHHTDVIMRFTPLWGPRGEGTETVANANANGTRTRAVASGSKTDNGKTVAVQNLTTIGVLSQEFISVDYRRDHQSETLLLSAVRAGAIDAVKLLLGASADIETTDKEGLTPLFVAILHNNEKLAEMLLNAGASPGARDRLGNTALHVAVTRSSIPGAGEGGGEATRAAIVRLIVGSGFAPDVIDSQGRTPLTMAAMGGLASCLDVLLTAKADPNFRGRGEFATALHAVAWGTAGESGNGNENAGGGDSLAKGKVATVIQLLVEAQADIDGSDDAGQRPLHIAARKTSPILAYSLIHRKCNVDARDTNGSTALHIAIGQDSTTSHEICNMLLDARCDVNLSNRSGETPLHIVSRKHNAAYLAPFLDKGHPDLQAVTIKRQTALHVAALQPNNNFSLQLLLAAGVDVHARDCTQRVALDLAQDDDNRNVLISKMGLVATGGGKAGQSSVVRHIDSPFQEIPAIEAAIRQMVQNGEISEQHASIYTELLLSGNSENIQRVVNTISIPEELRLITHLARGDLVQGPILWGSTERFGVDFETGEYMVYLHYLLPKLIDHSTLPSSSSSTTTTTTTTSTSSSALPASSPTLTSPPSSSSPYEAKPKLLNKASLTTPPTPLRRSGNVLIITNCRVIRLKHGLMYKSVWIKDIKDAKYEYKGAKPDAIHFFLHPSANVTDNKPKAPEVSADGQDLIMENELKLGGFLNRPVAKFLAKIAYLLAKGVPADQVRGPEVLRPTNTVVNVVSSLGGVYSTSPLMENADRWAYAEKVKGVVADKVEKKVDALQKKVAEVSGLKDGIWNKLKGGADKKK